MSTIDLIYFDAGGGHRAAATALRDLLTEQRRPWTIRLVQLMQVLDPQDRFRRFSGMAPEDVYNRRLARGWTIGLSSELRMLQAMIRLAHPMLVKRLQAHWDASRPDLVVSLVPNFNRELYESLQRSRADARFVTVMTDLADCPPHFWIEPGQDQDIVCGTDRAIRQALSAGYAPKRVHSVSGMILRRAFYAPSLVEGERGFSALGLDPKRPTGIVMFGGQGSARMLDVAKALDDVQLVLLCGHNDTLRRSLDALRRSAPHAAVGFTPDVPRYLRMGDFFVGKPGPGSISEAVHCALPVITFRNRWTLPQERFNARWVEEQGIGRVVASCKGLRTAVEEVLAELGPLRMRVRQIENRAVFEVAEVLATLLQETGQRASDQSLSTPGQRIA